MRIYLLGYMGSGKSTLGKSLAKNLNFGFIDLDTYLEKGYDKTISEIFATEGEARFREIEKEYLIKTSALENTVISTGGGTPCFNDNITWMNNNGITVYLQMTVEGLSNRLKNAKEERPLIKGLNATELNEFIRKNLEIREPFYKQANYIISGENVQAKKVINLLKET